MQFLLSGVFRSRSLEGLHRSPNNKSLLPALLCFAALHCMECAIPTKGAEQSSSKTKGLGLVGNCSNVKCERRVSDAVVIRHAIAYVFPSPLHYAL